MLSGRVASKGYSDKVARLWALEVGRRTLQTTEVLPHSMLRVLTYKEPNPSRACARFGILCISLWHPFQGVSAY